jgi:hypothetical protein
MPFSYLLSALTRGLPNCEIPAPTELSANSRLLYESAAEKAQIRNRHRRLSFIHSARNRAIMP